MRFLAISGSTRKGSTNTELLTILSELAAPYDKIQVFDGVGTLPIFSPDIDENAVPQTVQSLAAAIATADGLIISSPEYVRAIPGGLKNAIDWLVPREELVNKPIALVHASHRGDEMLDSLRLVLSTVTGEFDEISFLRLPLVSKTPEEVRAFLLQPGSIKQLKEFLTSFSSYIAASQTRAAI